MLETPKTLSTYTVKILMDKQNEMGNQQAREVSYIAGLMDGEGSFCITRATPRGSHHNIRYTPNVSFGITNQALAQKFKYFLEKYDIAYYEAKKIAPEPYLPVYSYIVRRMMMVKKFLEIVIPELVGKKRQAELLLEFINSRVDENGNVFRGGKGLGVYSQRTHDIWLEMRTLNGKGKPKGDAPLSAESIALTKRLARLHDYTSPLQVLHTPVAELRLAKDIVSPAMRVAAVQPSIG